MQRAPHEPGHDDLPFGERLVHVAGDEAVSACAYREARRTKILCLYGKHIANDVRQPSTIGGVQALRSESQPPKRGRRQRHADQRARSIRQQSDP
jgi:hypothetical protein